MACRNFTSIENSCRKLRELSDSINEVHGVRPSQLCCPVKKILTIIFNLFDAVHDVPDVGLYRRLDRRKNDWPHTS